MRVDNVDEVADTSRRVVRTIQMNMDAAGLVGESPGFAEPPRQGLYGSIMTTSPIRSSGIRSKTSRTKSAFGSKTSTLLPAFMSARIRCNIAVLFPEPVGPRQIVCSSESLY